MNASTTDREVPQNKAILVFGIDDALLETRRMVLEQAGFQVCSALRYLDAERLLRDVPIDLVLLCHTLPDAECSRTFALITQSHSQIKILSMTAHRPVCAEARNAPMVSTFGGPVSLVSAVRTVLSESEDPSESQG